MTLSPLPTITLTDHFATLADRYDVVFCDVWGVVHNGVTPFAAACDALARFRANGGTVVLLTNAPRKNEVVIGFLDRLGVPRDAWDAVVTSGDVARAEIAARRQESVFHIGPPQDDSVFREFDVRFASLEEADYAVCSGLFDDTSETPEDYRELLTRMKARDLFMVCANPDRVVERGDVLVYCAGAIADLYAELGGGVLFSGKPHRPIYRRALAAAEKLRGASVAREKVLAIGDSVRTDLTGADGFGIDCLFVTAGIHAGDVGGRETVDAEALAAMFSTAGMLPAAVTRKLAW
ncbi:HAD-superfamily hydrolase, subfamily IIA [Rhodovulum sp. PH10]|uniref:TIGR01459 family HAD-type hydrolase n=1 Tax=Rhodovulum sp. PH10 TaxID=1187851 RepID=UPI00027C1E8C|nr:TIGR01459 family HAD-type hydrolase [Rhodovulum sp. PH10]EJW10417.1 HAD-superfamily hydrolase, subfamily IIA [Rhodovulum sp. PH10]